MHLYELLERHSEAVLRRWEEMNRGAPNARSLTRQELRDSMPELLADLARAARLGRASIPEDGPRQHAVQRWEHDYSISDLVAEYQLLRLAILDEWSGRSGQVLQGDEVWTLERVINEAIRVAVESFAEQHARDVAESQIRLERAHEEARAAEGLLDAVVDQMVEPLAICDAEGRMIRMNEAGRALHGKDPSEGGARDWASSLNLRRLDGSPLPQEETPLLRALRGETVRGAELLAGPPGRPSVRLQINAVSLRGADGRLMGALSVGRDVTEERQAREMLQRLRLDAQRRAEAAQQLVSIVSHDLRTPLSVVLLSAGTLLRLGSLDERQTRAVTRIVSAAERAQRLIRDLLDFTQARLAGGLPIQRRPMDLAELLVDVVDELLVAFPGRKVIVEDGGPIEGSWDPDRLAQVLTNLVQNALQYGPPERPVRVWIRGEGEVVTIEVHNEGAPIPQETVDRLFEPFQRGSRLPSGAEHSVGLGLFIVRSIVEAHGGTIEVRSTEAEGTTFRVRLPHA